MNSEYKLRCLEILPKNIEQVVSFYILQKTEKDLNKIIAETPLPENFFPLMHAEFYKLFTHPVQAIPIEEQKDNSQGKFIIFYGLFNNLSAIVSQYFGNNSNYECFTLEKDGGFEMRSGIFKKYNDNIKINPHKDASFKKHIEYMSRIMAVTHFLKTGETYYNPE